MTLPVFHGLPWGSFGAILADPPWPFRIYSGTDNTPHRTEVDHYPVMSIDDLMTLPVARLAAPNCALFMWVVDAQLHRAVEVGNAWGFIYKTRAFEWLKTKKANDGYRIGMGYWTRKQAESCLLFTRGSPRRLVKYVRQIIEEPIREHSRKPDEVYRRIEQLVAGPYVELFATQRWPGWSGWGRDYPGRPDNTAARDRMTEALNEAIQRAANS